jgi:hypothetical protein
MKGTDIKEVVELIKGTFNIEELDELEREYNKMYQRLKAENELKEKNGNQQQDTE